VRTSIVRIALLMFPVLALSQTDTVLVPPRATAASVNGWRLYLQGESREAVVVVRFTVKADGSTADVQITDGFYTQEIANAIVIRVRNERHEPAMLGGQPVDYYGVTQTIRLGHNFGQTITPGFRNQYEAVQAVYQKGDYAGAAAQIETLISTRVKGLFEYAFLNKALIPIYARLNRPEEALRVSRLATLKDVPPDLETPTGTLIRPQASKWPYLLPHDNLVSALRMRFDLALQLGLVSEATQVYQELGSIDKLSADDPLTVALQQAQEQLRKQPLLMSTGRIGRGPWLNDLSRHTFTLSNVQGGSLQYIDLVCRLQRRRLDYKPDAEWTVPAAWGDCAVQVSGAEGTAFSLVQLQADTSSNEMQNAKPLVISEDAAAGGNRGTLQRGGTSGGNRDQAVEAFRLMKGRP